MVSHLMARAEKHWIFVFYVVPDEQKKRALQVIFDSITHVIVKNQHVTLEEKHRNVFRIYTAGDLQKMALNHYA